MNLVDNIQLFMYMKWILFVFSVLFAICANAQDGYVFTKEQHEQIKKNLQDYRTLIKDYKVLNHRFDSLKNAFHFLKKLHSVQTIEFEELKVKYQSLKRENADLIFYTEENKKLKEQLGHTERNLEIKTKDMFKFKRMYEREHRLTRGDRIIGNTILGTFVMCAIWGIYISVEANYVH